MIDQPIVLDSNTGEPVYTLPDLTEDTHFIINCNLVPLIGGEYTIGRFSMYHDGNGWVQMDKWKQYVVKITFINGNNITDIESSCFKDFSALTEIYFYADGAGTGTGLPNLERLNNYACQGTSSLTHFTLGPLAVIGTSAFKLSGLTTISDSNFPSGNCAPLCFGQSGSGGGAINANRAFSESDLISVTIPEAATQIHTMCFSKCYSLETLYIPEGMLSIGSRIVDYGGGSTLVVTFAECGALVMDSTAWDQRSANGGGASRITFSIPSLTNGMGSVVTESWPFVSSIGTDPLVIETPPPPTVAGGIAVSEQTATDVAEDIATIVDAGSTEEEIQTALTDAINSLIGDENLTAAEWQSFIQGVIGTAGVSNDIAIEDTAAVTAVAEAYGIVADADTGLTLVTSDGTVGEAINLSAAGTADTYGDEIILMADGLTVVYFHNNNGTLYKVESSPLNNGTLTLYKDDSTDAEIAAEATKVWVLKATETGCDTVANGGSDNKLIYTDSDGTTYTIVYGSITAIQEKISAAKKALRGTSGKERKALKNVIKNLKTILSPTEKKIIAMTNATTSTERLAATKGFVDTISTATSSFTPKEKRSCIKSFLAIKLADSGAAYDLDGDQSDIDMTLGYYNLRRGPQQGIVDPGTSQAVVGINKIKVSTIGSTTSINEGELSYTPITDVGQTSTVIVVDFQITVTCTATDQYSVEIYDLVLAGVVLSLSDVDSGANVHWRNGPRWVGTALGGAGVTGGIDLQVTIASTLSPAITYTSAPPYAKDGRGAPTTLVTFSVTSTLPTNDITTENLELNGPVDHGAVMIVAGTGMNYTVTINSLTAAGIYTLTVPSATESTTGKSLGEDVLFSWNFTASGIAGEPIVAPLYGSPFKLPVDAKNYLLFDNQDLGQRLIINVKLHILPEEERLKIQEYCDEVWGRPQNLLSYMKYISVFWEGEWTSYDMDTLSLCDVPSNSAIDNIKLKSKETLETTLSNRVVCWYNEKHDTESAEISWKTNKHGMVTLNLEKYADPEIRNGARLSGGNITKENSFGALVACAAAKNLLVKKPLSTPKIQNDYTHDLALISGGVEYKGEIIMRDMLYKGRKGDRIRPGRKLIK